MKVNEIFTSIQGEGTRAGAPCTFVRFTACDLRCVYCDTEHAFHGGRPMDIAAIASEVAARAVPLVCVTGGEPLLQRDIVPFLEVLLERGHTVLLETGGHRSLAEVPREVVRIVDVKTPGAFRPGWPPEYARSEAFVAHHFCYSNLDHLAPHDELKFVVTDRADFDWACAFIREHGLAGRAAALHISPSWGVVPLPAVVDWVLSESLPLRLNVQLHKFIWGPEARGV
jgi:7-carboxy-7-deazaguanine synthase